MKIMNLSIRPYQTADEAAIENITFRTGFKGEGLEGRDYFHDKRLFYLIFIAYYARYEQKHFFVAIDEDLQGTVGFICGAPDTNIQEKRFANKMIWRIAYRTFLVTMWRHPKTLITLLKLGKVLIEMRSNPELTAKIHAHYPAHLHINVLPEYHRSGIGTLLLSHFEKHMTEVGVEGIHLETSSRNHKAVPFYHKHGYTIVKEALITSHPVFDEIKFYTFAKMLTF